MSPGLLLAILVVLIATQLTRVLRPGRGPYILTLGLAIMGLLIGELIALTGRFAGPELGVLHPIPDIVTIFVLEAMGVGATKS